MYLEKFEVTIRNIIDSSRSFQDFVFVTDEADTAAALKEQGEAVLIYFHEGNDGQDFSAFRYGVEDPMQLAQEPEYLERIYRRLKGLPWNILETERLLVRETTVEDVDAFWEIYQEPSITKYTEGLYPKIEQERAYVREYIEQVYALYEYGIWTVVEKDSGAVIGRVGFSERPGYELPELGFVVGVPWQKKGYAYEACKAILEYGREELGFQAVQLLVEQENEASLKLCAKLEFEDTGELVSVSEEGTCSYRRLMKQLTDVLELKRGSLV